MIQGLWFEGALKEKKNSKFSIRCSAIIYDNLPIPFPDLDSAFYHSELWSVQSRWCDGRGYGGVGGPQHEEHLNTPYASKE